MAFERDLQNVDQSKGCLLLPLPPSPAISPRAAAAAASAASASAPAAARTALALARRPAAAGSGFLAPHPPAFAVAAAVSAAALPRALSARALSAAAAASFGSSSSVAAQPRRARGPRAASPAPRRGPRPPPSSRRPTPPPAPQRERRACRWQRRRPEVSLALKERPSPLGRPGTGRPRRGPADRGDGLLDAPELRRLLEVPVVVQKSDGLGDRPSVAHPPGEPGLLKRRRGKRRRRRLERAVAVELGPFPGRRELLARGRALNAAAGDSKEKEKESGLELEKASTEAEEVAEEDGASPTRVLAGRGGGGGRDWRRGTLQEAPELPGLLRSGQGERRWGGWCQGSRRRRRSRQRKQQRKRQQLSWQQQTQPQRPRPESCQHRRRKKLRLRRQSEARRPSRFPRAPRRAAAPGSQWPRRSAR